MAIEKLLLEAPGESQVKVITHGHFNHDSDGLRIYQGEHKMLPVPKTDAIVEPEAVVVHVEHAPVTRRAVVAPFRLKHVTHEAVATFLLSPLAILEAPEGWNLSGITHCCLVIRPNQHVEIGVENY